MQHYYASNLPGPDGRHEVHTLGCAHMPLSKTLLGMHARCETALEVARRTFRTAYRCGVCCPPQPGHRPASESPGSATRTKDARLNATHLWTEEA